MADDGRRLTVAEEHDGLRLDNFLTALLPDHSSRNDQADEDGDMAANFMWFSSAQELRSPKKRTDFLEVRALSAARLANVG